MLCIVTGSDRVRAGEEIKKLLGEEYEVIEGVELEENDLPSVFLGASLFSEVRNILIRDLTVRKDLFAELPKYLETPHNVVMFETNLDKRAAAFKVVRDKVTIKEFDLPPDVDGKVVFDVYRVAKRDGSKAVEMLRRVEHKNDPIMFVGLMASQALKEYSARQGVVEKSVLRELAKLDLAMKNASGVDNWLLVEAFLLNLSGLYR